MQLEVDLDLVNKKVFDLAAQLQARDNECKDLQAKLLLLVKEQ